MTFNVYSIRDVKSGFSVPMTEMNDAVAMRNFSNAVNVANSIYQTSAKDFSLYRIGRFEFDTGKLTPDQPELICEAYSLLLDRE